jgi:hypothetical protein
MSRAGKYRYHFMPKATSVEIFQIGIQKPFRASRPEGFDQMDDARSSFDHCLLLLRRRISAASGSERLSAPRPLAYERGAAPAFCKFEYLKRPYRRGD